MLTLYPCVKYEQHKVGIINCLALGEFKNLIVNNE